MLEEENRNRSSRVGGRETSSPEVGFLPKGEELVGLENRTSGELEGGEGWYMRGEAW